MAKLNNTTSTRTELFILPSVYPRYQLVGPKKITCLKDGSYNTDPPSCQLIDKKPDLLVPTPRPAVPDLETAPRRPYPARRPPPTRDQEPDQSPPPVRKVEKPVDREVPAPPRRPEDNEIPDSSNVLSSAAGADLPEPEQKQTEAGQQKQELNIGKQNRNSK